MKKLVITIEDKKAESIKASLKSNKDIIDVEDWDEIQNNDDDDFELSPELIAELERRQREMEDDPNLGLSWDEVKKRIKDKYGF